jgi:ABC-type transporter Mla MlaB component
MYQSRQQDHVTVVRAWGELSRGELVSLAAVAERARKAGRTVVLDLKGVTRLHAAGAALLATVPGLRAAGASRFVREQVDIGAAGRLVLFDDVEEAVRAA